MTDNAKWLAGLNVGHPVIVRTSHFASPGWLTKIARVTARQIVVSDESRFRRRDGNELGRFDYHGRWLEEPTAEARAAIRHHALQDGLKQIHWQDLPLATLEAVLDLVSKAAIEAKR